MELARATDADVPAIVALMNHAYRGGVPEAWNSESYISGARTTETALREQIAGQPEGWQLIWRPSPDAAIQATVWIEPYGGDVWYLGGLTIDPAAQNGGLGRELLAAAKRWVQRHGGHRIRMTVINIRAGLLAWYGRRGYRLTEETQPFPYDDDRLGTPLRDDLFFVILEKQLV